MDFDSAPRVFVVPIGLAGLCGREGLRGKALAGDTVGWQRVTLLETGALLEYDCCHGGYPDRGDDGISPPVLGIGEESAGRTPDFCNVERYVHRQ